MARAEVLFYGNSIYLDSLATGLQSSGRVRVFRSESSNLPIMEELRMLHPDGVIFELEERRSEPFVADFTIALPLIRFMGIHPDREMMTVFSATGNRLAPVAELEEVILERAAEGIISPQP
jgi:hypothetical protein